MELFDLSILEIVIRLLLGLAIGFCIGLTGVGGGVLVLPSLTVFLGLDPIKAVGTTSLYAFLTKIAATYHHFRLGTIDWGISLRFLAGAIPANIFFALWISGQGSNERFKQSLEFFITGVVIFLVAAMIVNMVARSRQALEEEERTLASKINGRNLVRNSLSILLGVVVGALLGATSIGGGVLIVPMLIILFGLPSSRTVGSSILIAFILALVTSSIYGTSGEVDRVTAVIMAVGSLAGVYYGSRLSVKLPETMLRAVVLCLILIAALIMLLN